MDDILMDQDSRAAAGLPSRLRSTSSQLLARQVATPAVVTDMLRIIPQF